MLGAAAVVTLRPAEATPATMKAAIRKVIGDAAVKTGKVKLDMPPLVENGNTVPLTVSVDSPMTPERPRQGSIHVFNEKNPQPNVDQLQARPACRPRRRSRRASASPTRRRSSRSRSCRDGSFWSASADVIVTLGACPEEVI